jgi:hypothetical protein
MKTVLDFIRHYWLSSFGVTRKSEFYASMKSEITSCQSSVDFAERLAHLAPLYAAIVSPDDETWKRFDLGAKEDMSTLNLLKVEQIRPLIPAILEQFSPIEVKRALHLMVAWAVRFLTVGGGGGGTLERHYSDIAVKIRNKELTSAKHLASAMKDAVPNDAQFRSSFETLLVPQSNVARYYLTTLEEVEKGNTNAPLLPSKNPTAVNLEHILQQNPTSEWSDVDPFALTSAVAPQSKWGIAEIEARQQHLSRLATTAWSI